MKRIAFGSPRRFKQAGVVGLLSVVVLVGLNQMQLNNARTIPGPSTPAANAQGSGESLAQLDLGSLGRAELQLLIEIKYGLEALEALRDSGGSDSLLAGQRSQYVTRARLLVGDSVPSATLDLLLDEVELGGLLAGQSVFQRIRGFLTFVNIVSTVGDDSPVRGRELAGGTVPRPVAGTRATGAVDTSRVGGSRAGRPLICAQRR